MRAKFMVQSRTETHYSTNVELTAVGTGNEDDKKFFAATPSGTLNINVVNKDVAEAMKPGKKFYIDFTEAE